jgi:hypothetical protein
LLVRVPDANSDLDLVAGLRASGPLTVDSDLPANSI